MDEQRTILVVDDATILTITERVLRGAGYDVETAMTGEEALPLPKSRSWLWSCWT